MSDIDNDKVGALVGKMLGDLGGAFCVPSFVIGIGLTGFHAFHGDLPTLNSGVAVAAVVSDP